MPASPHTPSRGNGVDVRRKLGPSRPSSAPVLEIVFRPSGEEPRALLTVHPGDRIALVGDADAGRASLVQALAGLEAPFVRPLEAEHELGTTHVFLNGVDLTFGSHEGRRYQWLCLGVV